MAAAGQHAWCEAHVKIRISGTRSTWHTCDIMCVHRAASVCADSAWPSVWWAVLHAAVAPASAYSWVCMPVDGSAVLCCAMLCRGVPVVEVNLEPTDNSSVCRLSIQGRAGKLLPELFGVADDPAVAAAIAERSSSR